MAEGRVEEKDGERGRGEDRNIANGKGISTRWDFHRLYKIYSGALILIVKRRCQNEARVFEPAAFLGPRSAPTEVSNLGTIRNQHEGGIGNCCCSPVLA